MAWLEVESKSRIDDVNELRQKLKRIANFAKREEKDDRYFALKKGQYPKKAFRIRSNGKEFVINFKKWLRDLYSKDIVVKE